MIPEKIVLVFKYFSRIYSYLWECYSDILLLVVIGVAVAVCAHMYIHFVCFKDNIA